MALAVERGARVTTRDFGPGTVTRVTRTGLVVELDENGLQIEVADGDYHIDQPATPTSPASIAADAELPGTAGALAPDELDARCTIEALRFGLVPVRGLERLTLGFQELRDWIVEQLPHSRSSHPTASEIAGPFGTGKSHTMAVVRLVAEQEGYLTAKVEVDGKNVSLSDPERLLYALWRSLRGRNLESPTPLLDVYLKAIEQGHAPPRIAPAGVDRVHDNYAIVRTIHKTGNTDEVGHAIDALLSSSPEFTAFQVARLIAERPNIYGLDVGPKRMIGRDIVDRPYDFVEAIVGHTHVATLAGYKGIVITIDEFEVEHFLTTQNFQRIEQLLTALTQYLAGQMKHQAVPVAFFFATVGEENHVGDKVVDAMMNAVGGACRVLDPRPSSELRELASRIFELYAVAYEVPDDAVKGQLLDVAEAQVADAIGDDSGRTRAFIKSFVSLLDAHYGPSRP